MRAIEIRTVAVLPKKFDGSTTQVRLKRNTLPPKIIRSRKKSSSKFAKYAGDVKTRL